MYLGMEMEEKIIRKDEFHNLLAKLTESYQVFAPVSKGKLVVFEEIHAEDEISLDYSNAEKSVKELFFPQRERLFTFNIPQGNEIREPAPSDKKRVILGIRPCDARSVSLLDNVFDDKVYQDPYYLNKRKNTLIVALGCNHPESTCFCTSTGGDPFSTDGSDVLLVDIGDSYLVQTVTEKGGSFLEQQKALFKKANEEHTRLKEKIVEKARTSITSQANLGGLKKKLDKNFDAPLWGMLHEKCLGCGVCTFFCPTCHCFDILDETRGSAGERIRIWDSCMFPFFTLHASGDNPRPSGKERMRQRVMHKFKYFADNYGKVACSGCGRCIRSCPVNLDIREVLRKIQSQ